MKNMKKTTSTTPPMKVLRAGGKSSNLLFWIVATILVLIFCAIAAHVMDDLKRNQTIDYQNAQLTRDSLVIDSLQMEADTTLLRHSEIIRTDD